jgi:voltage-gated potassium channel
MRPSGKEGASGVTIVDTGKSIFFRHRFAVLFVLLLCVLLIPPYFQDADWLGRFWRGLFTVMLFWSLYSVVGSRRVLMLAVILLIPTVGSTWLADPGQERYLAYLDNLTNILYFGLISAFLGKYILTSRKVTLEVIFAAMCLYMILAVLWAAIYTNLEIYYVGAFTFNGQSAELAGVAMDELYSNMIYFSFVTLSTLGYGDILPVHRVAQNWAAVEAMIGQFFIAIVIARLVALYTVEEEEEHLEQLPKK